MPTRSWERATKEVVFYPCPLCCQRLEVELDNSGTSLSWLYVTIANHYYVEHEQTRLPEWRELQLAARVDTVDLYAPIDLSDIITKCSLKRRIRHLAGDDYEGFQRARNKLEARIRTLVTRQGHYVCKICGKRIIKQRAEKYGYGVSHTADEIQAQNETEEIPSRSAQESVRERGQIRAFLSPSYG